VFQKLRQLGGQLVVYGLGDVATSVVGFLLLPVFTSLLTKDDYGVLGLLTGVEVVAKVIFRWGVDASFMRFYYDCEDDEARRRLAGTIFLFLIGVNGTLLAGALVVAPFVSEDLFGLPGFTLALQLVLINTFVGGFYFLPFHVLRIQRRALVFSLANFARTFGTLLFRILFVIGLGHGVMGVVVADTVVTAVFAPALAIWFAPYIRAALSRPLLRDVLRFGLPRVPHGIAQQVIGPGTDNLLLRIFLRLPDAAVSAAIGLYVVPASIGLAMKYFLSAFETAWAPFYFATMKEPDAKRTFAGITTYGMAVLVLLAAGLSAISTDVVRLMTKPDYVAAAGVIPWITVGVVLQGFYLLTSIGLNITKHTEYYPVATAIGAVVNVTANALLIPWIGIFGPAVANALSFAVLAGVAYRFSHRFYPVPHEWGRLGRVVAAGVASLVAARWLIPAEVQAIMGVIGRGAIVVVVYAGLLAATGFFTSREIARMRRLVRLLRPARG
jgi:O-antigen/teichoic acid export membrane protein